VTDADEKMRPRSLGFLGDASLLVAILTAIAYAGGHAQRDAYFGHWRLPAGEPGWDTSVLLEKGFEAGGAFILVFLLWLFAASEGGLSKGGKTERSLRAFAMLVPFAIFTFAAVRTAMIAFDLAKAHAWLLLVAVVILLALLARLAWSFFRELPHGPTLGRSRTYDVALVAIVVVGLLTCTLLLGSLLGDSNGSIDAAGDKSTLLRVHFEFVDNASHERQDWRLLAHSDGTYYVFDFDGPKTSAGQPIVTMIPDSAVAEARLTPP